MEISMLLPFTAFPDIATHMLERASKLKARILFFPESGAIPLRTCIENQLTKRIRNASVHNFILSSSKITAYTKTPLSTQLLGLLSESEKNRTLTAKELRVWNKLVGRAPYTIQRAIQKIRLTHSQNRCVKDYILAFADLGICVNETWRKTTDNPLFEVKKNTIHLRRSPRKEQRYFDQEKKKSLEQLIQHTATQHDARPLLQFLLSHTTFAKNIRKGPIYVCDDTISRGRTLVTLDLVFRSFLNKPQWSIGVCSSAVAAKQSSVLDYVYSTRISPFMNRPDFIGSFIVASKNTFVRHTPPSLFGTHKLTKSDRLKLETYEKKSSLFLSQLSVPLKEISASRELMHFCFMNGKAKTLAQCLLMNPEDAPQIAEEAMLFIRLPHPLAPITKRELTQEYLIQHFQQFQRIQQTKTKWSKQWNHLQTHYHSIRPLYLANERAKWISSKNRIDRLWNKSTS